jgi:hypothetical protein
MATEKQIAANRLNAAKSTGPKTADGKARSSHNAIKHGMTAKSSLLSHEDEHHFSIWRGELMRELSPVGFSEELLVHRIIQCFWRLSRAARYERVFADDADTRPPDAPVPSHAELDDRIKDCFAKGLYDHLSLYESRAERALYNAFKELRLRQEMRQAPRQPQPRERPSLPPPSNYGVPRLPKFDIASFFRSTKITAPGFAAFLNEAIREDCPEIIEEPKSPQTPLPDP